MQRATPSPFQKLARRALGLAAIAVVSGFSLAANAQEAKAESDAHADILSEDNYPTAAQCGTCHTQIYEEWASSNHAYSAISPMFHKFEQKINDLSSGTVRAFCVRCHQQIGTQLNERRDLPLWERSQIAREGVTCITCHRVRTQFGKVNGERTVTPGKIYLPVSGAGKGETLAKIVENRGEYRVSTSPEERGAQIHTGVYTFDQISKSEFCVSCHQVAVNPGIKLEVVWDQYRASPAAAAGVTCQDCHMGKVPGRAEGYATAPVAILNGEEIDPGRKHSNHAFYGPGYPIAHPGIFPHNPDAAEIPIEDWLQFDYRAGWGSEEFEAKVESGEISEDIFPEAWSDSFDREEAWEMIQENYEALEYKRDLRRQVMENGSRLDGPFFSSRPAAGSSLGFDIKITNTDDGHNLPSGSLGAQPEIWLNVAVMAPSGKTVWESGYVDSNGDMADLHSLDLAAGKIEHDDQLFNLQTKFLFTN
ncbi:MAG: multiheme c-type cytochrome, partial [Bauldia litoralis]